MRCGFCNTKHEVLGGHSRVGGHGVCRCAPEKLLAICAEINSCKIPMTTDRNATVAESNDFCKTFLKYVDKTFSTQMYL